MGLINRTEASITERQAPEQFLPRVSVVVPTRNRPHLLCRAVRTALGQGLRDLEVVVVIDGSEAGADLATHQALAAIDDLRLRVIPLDYPAGGSEARNIGVREARGHWIALLDDDDEFLPGKLEKQLHRAESSAGLRTLVTSRFIARSARTAEIWPRRAPAEGEPLSEYLFRRRHFTRGEGALQTSTFFCQRALLLETPFQKGLKRHQDWDWLLRIAERGDVAIELIAEPLSIYHRAEQRESVSESVDWRSSLRWARQNRDRITPRAYSFFVAAEVAPQAAEAREGIGTCLALLRECLFGGSPTPFALTLFAGYYLLPRRLRTGARTFVSGARARLQRVR
jgi:glycosyltransferase involved in cell wall biosynthesis